MFQFKFRPCSASAPGWGDVAVIPWDTEIFGFPVGVYRPADARALAADLAAFRRTLEAWARQQRVQLISASVPAAPGELAALLLEAGFVPVETSVHAVLNGVQRAQFLPALLPVRPAEPGDRSDIERISETAFDFGRYHADPRFPRRLADRRYQRWVVNALASGGNDLFYVAGLPGRILGFMHVVVDGTSADLRLAAVDRAVQGGNVGYSLYAGTLEALRRAGVRRAEGKLSPTNVGVLNVFAALGFRFSRPETAFHWHAPEAPDLLSRHHGLRAA